jgi:amino acid adenylation domain-containing protein/thioester reductase-like protein
MVLCAAWAMLLARLSGHDDIAIGTQVANRPRPELEALIGVFVNTLVLRVGVSAHSRIDELLKQVKEVTLGAYDHQEVPFDRVVEALRPQRSLARNPLFQAMFVLTTPRSELRLPQLTVTLEDGVTQHATVDLLLLLEERGEELTGTLDYAAELFDRATVERWRACFISLLREMTENAQARVGDLKLLPESERREVLEQFNATRVSFPRGKQIHELFEEQVTRAPNAPAVIFEGQSLTYAALNDKADQLARHLSARGVGPDRLVGICVERSPEMIVGLLGILKAGGAYLPLDPALPRERLAYMLTDAAPSVLLTQERLRNLIPSTAAEVIAMEGDWSEHAEISQQLTSRNLAYVIYTSGSTGAPKGVMIEHESVVNFLSSMRVQPGIEPTDSLLAVTTLSFDIAGLEIFLPLLNGARIVLAKREVTHDAQQLMHLLDSGAISMMQATPATWQLLIDAGWRGNPRLKALCGGEALTADLAAKLSSRVGPLWNLYGPTETTIWSCAHRIETAALGHGAVESIGAPIANTRVYILDAHGRPAPIGVTGEIFIAGAGLARGYLNRPTLTADRFLSDPYCDDPLARMYKTGDVGRWRADGTISYVGRNDQQVKIRGFRIETGEIEARLRRHPQVKEAVVLARENVPGDRQLAAYVVADFSERSELIPQLRDSLREWLPDYMIPAAWKILARLPLTPSGKVDRNALPAPDSGGAEPSHYVAPQTELERSLADILAQVLRVEAVGLHDNFFDLGGHSLLVIRAVFRINQALASNLTGADLYKSPTVAELARRLSEGEAEDGLVELAAEAVLDESIRAIADARGSSRRSIALEDAQGSSLRSAAIARAGRAAPRSILLTGGTGFVGRFLLAQLLQDTDAVIHCLVRADSEAQAAKRLKETLVTWDLWREELARRIVAVPGDLRAPRLGIDAQTYQHLAHTIDTVYHCATRMNHLETYAATKAANVESSQTLVRFATEQRPKVINFISTLDVFSAETGGISRSVSEHSSIDAEKHRKSQGYVASKWVSEKIFMLANERGIACNIFRLGLTWADTKLGRYDELQREYRLLKTCLLSGYGIQDYHYEVPPTPVDYAARAVVFLANQHADGKGIFHVSSPDQMREGVFERCNAVAGTSLELLPLYRWTREIERLYGEGQAMPIVPLIEQAFGLDEASFYEREQLETRKPRFDCTRTIAALDQAGITAPVLNDDLLKTCVRSLLARDADLQRKQ